MPYFKAGLENKEFCVWVFPKPVTEPEAWKACERQVLELGDRTAT